MTLPWKTFDASAVDTTSNDYALIPAKTKLPLIIGAVKEDEYQGEQFWTVETIVADNPIGFVGAHHWTKLKFLTEPDKAQKKLAQLVIATDLVEQFKRDFSPESLAMLTDKLIVGEFAQWKSDDGKTGNWIRSFEPYTATSVAPKPVAASAPAAAASSGPAWKK